MYLCIVGGVEHDATEKMLPAAGLVMDGHHGSTGGSTDPIDGIHCGARDNILAEAAVDASEQTVNDDQHKAAGVLREQIIDRFRVIQIKRIVGQNQLPIERISGHAKAWQDFDKALLHLL